MRSDTLMFVSKQIENKINEEISSILKEINTNIEQNDTDNSYRNSKIYVLAVAIKNNIEEFLNELNKDNEKTLVEVEDYFLSQNGTIKELYLSMYEESGSGKDYFLNKTELFGAIKYFLEKIGK